MQKWKYIIFWWNAFNPQHLFSFGEEFWFEGGNKTFQQQSLIFNFEQEQNTHVEESKCHSK